MRSVGCTSAPSCCSASCSRACRCRPGSVVNTFNIYIYVYLKNTVPHRYSFYSRGCRWVVLRPMSVFLNVGCQYSTSAPSMLTTAHSKTKKNLLFDVWVIIACFFHFINDVGATRHPSPHPGGTDGTAIAAPPDCHQRPGDDDEARVGESAAPQPPAAWRVP